MRTSAIKIVCSLFLLMFVFVGHVNSAPSRFDCLVKLGNNASKDDLDSCVKGNPVASGSSSQVSSIDTSSEEAACLDLGFKKKTPLFANCVLELLERKENTAASPDPDDNTCRKYGFKRKTNEYASCRQQIDQARAQEKQRVEQYNAQQAQYQAQLKEYQRQKEIQANLALMQIGLGMMAGGSSGGYGAPPVAPVAPQMGPRTYVLPNNKIMTCNTTGNITNCF